MQFVQVIPVKNYTEKKWLMKKYQKCINITAQAFANYIVIENCVRRENSVKKVIRK
ncbi:hypothetical protein [Clostridium sp.]|jgi:hypothetical protein|uniref:hypothetical protein n=1 Tax=Clostridium sp. TaxID=1506 RepID=UPI003EEEAF43